MPVFRRKDLFRVNQTDIGRSIDLHYKKKKEQVETKALLLKTGLIQQEDLSLIGLELSYSEEICLELYCQGKTRKEVAKIMDRSERTIEMYLDEIKSKMGVSKKHDLFQKAIKFEIIKKFLD